ncbi:MAG TPA: efflux RND transporter permease subunit [Thermodesulfovibrionales bacterium]|nr:efflux RND transporter permease subunit [Thermodesulfovibrionales bacterium]
MPGEHYEATEGHSTDKAAPGPVKGFFRKVNRFRDSSFERFREGYGRVLEVTLHHRLFVLLICSLIGLISLGLFFVVGTDFFPAVDVGLMKLHFRAPAGTRIEETERLVAQIEKRIRDIIPENDIETINDMIGVPIFFNLAFVQTENIAGTDAEILIALKEGHHPTAMYRQKLRNDLPRQFPGSSFYFEPADIVTQVLNFGLAACNI